MTDRHRIDACAQHHPGEQDRHPCFERQNAHFDGQSDREDAPWTPYAPSPSPLTAEMNRSRTEDATVICTVSQFTDHGRARQGDPHRNLKSDRHLLAGVTP